MIEGINDWLNTMPEEFRQKIYTQNNLAIRWASSDHLNVQIELSRMAYRDGADFYHTLTGQCRTVCTTDFFVRFFEEHKDQSFMENFCLVGDDPACPETWRHGIGLSRIQFYSLYDLLDFKKFPRLYRYLNRKFNALQKICGVSRLAGILNGNKPYGGLSYWSINRSAMEQLLNHPIIKDKNYRNTFCAEELIPQTVLANVSANGTLPKNSLQNHTLRFLDWNKVHGESPGILDQTHFVRIRAPESPAFPFIFARKFDSSISKELILLLEKNP